MFVFSVAFIAVTVFGLSVSSTEAGILLKDAGTDDRIASISGLYIEGQTFDVTFHHGVAFDELGSNAISFDSQASADAASAAIDQLMSTSNLFVSDTAAAGTRFTDSYLVPFQAPGATTVTSVARGMFRFPQYDFNDNGDVVQNVSNVALESYSAYTTFSPSNAATVPEPSSLVVASMGAVALGFRRRRRFV